MAVSKVIVEQPKKNTHISAAENLLIFFDQSGLGPLWAVELASATEEPTKHHPFPLGFLLCCPLLLHGDILPKSPAFKKAGVKSPYGLQMVSPSGPAVKKQTYSHYKSIGLQNPKMASYKAHKISTKTWNPSKKVVTKVARSRRLRSQPVVSSNGITLSQMKRQNHAWQSWQTTKQPTSN